MIRLLFLLLLVVQIIAYSKPLIWIQMDSLLPLNSQEELKFSNIARFKSLLIDRSEFTYEFYRRSNYQGFSSSLQGCHFPSWVFKFNRNQVEPVQSLPYILNYKSPDSIATFLTPPFSYWEHTNDQSLFPKVYMAIKGAGSLRTSYYPYPIWEGVYGSSQDIREGLLKIKFQPEKRNIIYRYRFPGSETFETGIINPPEVKEFFFRNIHDDPEEIFYNLLLRAEVIFSFDQLKIGEVPAMVGDFGQINLGQPKALMNRLEDHQLVLPRGYRMPFPDGTKMIPLKTLAQRAEFFAGAFPIIDQEGYSRDFMFLDLSLDFNGLVEKMWGHYQLDYSDPIILRYREKALTQIDAMLGALIDTYPNRDILLTTRPIALDMPMILARVTAPHVTADMTGFDQIYIWPDTLTEHGSEDAYDFKAFPTTIHFHSPGLGLFKNATFKNSMDAMLQDLSGLKITLGDRSIPLVKRIVNYGFVDSIKLALELGEWGHRVYHTVELNHEAMHTDALIMTRGPELDKIEMDPMSSIFELLPKVVEQFQLDFDTKPCIERNNQLGF